MIKHHQHTYSIEVSKQFVNLREDLYFGYKHVSKISPVIFKLYKYKIKNGLRIGKQKILQFTSVGYYSTVCLFCKYWLAQDSV